METDLNFEEMWKDPKFRELVGQYRKPLATNSKPSSSSGAIFSALGSKSMTELRVSEEDDKGGQPQTRDTHTPSIPTPSVSSSMEVEISYTPTNSIQNTHHRDMHMELQQPSPTNKASSRSHQDSVHNKNLPSRQSPSHHERSYSPHPESSHPCREYEVFEGYHHDQVKQDYSSRRLHSTSRDRNYDQYQDHRSRSCSPRHYNNGRNYHSRSRSRSCSPRPDKYNSNRYLYRSERLDSPHRSHEHYEQNHYPRKHLQSPQQDRAPPPCRTEIKPLDPSESLPSLPHGWDDKDYYYSAQTSYTRGGKGGDRGGGMRGGPSMVFDKSGMQVKYKTPLEKMSKGAKYHFVKAHNHPFADVAGIHYFNPYGKVPLDNKLTAIIPKATGSLFISSGQRLDFPEYLEGRAVTRAAIAYNLPNNATIEPGKSLSWSHFGLSVRLKVYEYVYDFKPYYYHFRDKTGENNWLIDSIAREYLKEVGGYLKKSGNNKTDPMDYLRRHAAKNMKNKEMQKSYIEEPDADNPYYFPKFGADKKYAGSTRALKGLAKDTAPASSSTQARDARRADRVVAQEEARAKEEARALKPGKPGKPAPAKAAPKAGSAKDKTKTKFKRDVQSDEDSDDETRLPPRSKRKVASSEVEELEEYERPAKKTTRLDKPEEKKPEKKSEKRVLLIKERARNKMRPRPDPEPRENEPELSENDEDSKQTQSEYSSDAEEPNVSQKMSKQAVSSKQGRQPRFDEEAAVIEEGSNKERVTKRAKRNPTPVSSDVEDSLSIGYKASIDGIRIVKTTKMIVKAPISGPVASRPGPRRKAKE